MDGGGGGGEDVDGDDVNDGNLVSHVIGGQHGQELTEEDGAKEQCEDPFIIIMMMILRMMMMRMIKII